jgi:hypothetical protein
MTSDGCETDDLTPHMQQCESCRRWFIRTVWTYCEECVEKLGGVVNRDKDEANHDG